VNQAARDHYYAELVLFGGVEDERTCTQRDMWDPDTRGLLGEADGSYKDS